MSKNINDILNRGVTNIIPGEKELEKLLKSNKKLNVYLGVDPTATKIHIGNAVPLRKLQAFAELGHNVTFLIGDFTALIGDTSDKESERPVLTYEEIQENFKTYKEQAENIVDFSKVNVRFNSEWLKKLDFAETIKLCQHFSVGDFLSRELIRKRLDNGKRVALHEILYPVMQGYDSYYMDTDIQIGGADQTFNMQAGRTLQKDLRNKESFVIVTGYLEGTDGRKMSKSWGNAIWLTDDPNEMYGKVMSINDDLIPQYFTLSTTLPMEEVEEKLVKARKNPMEIKKDLAYQIVKELHNETSAQQAQEQFELTFQKGEVPDEIKEVTVDKNRINVVDLIEQTDMVESRSQIKRLLDQGAITIDNEVVSDIQDISIDSGKVIKIGKHRFVKVLTKS